MRRIEVAKDGSTVTFAAFIPAGLANAPSGQKHIFPFVPAAYVFIHAPGNPVQIHEIGITSRTLAAIFTIVAVVCAGWMMYRFAKYLGVPGPSAAAATGVGGAIASALRGFSVPLRIISSAQGWASLSQFQMMLWTFVIGAGAVYVMSLTGSLIPISPGTLVLLGIAGGAAVLTEVKASQQQQPTAPAPVLELRTVGPPLDTEILVSWLPSATGATATSYIVQYEHPGAPNEWRYASSDLRSPGFRIVGLDPNTAYRVRVLARNTAGNSAEAVVPTPTANVPAVAASITNLRVQPSSLNDSEVVLEWDAAAGALPTDFIVQMRRADTDEPWDAAAGPPTVAATTGRLMVRGLAATTRYDFRVRRATVAGGWTYLTVKTQPLVRTPKWSDIVTDTDRPAEIDVTRVQMLFFTVISAFFVGLKIIDTGLIPDIDPTYVTLMGISNGVYVTAKFVRN